MTQVVKYESTEIAPEQSAGEIASLVHKYGGARFEMLWDEFGRLSGIRFAIRHDGLGEIPVRLTARTGNVESLIHERRPYSSRMRRTRKEYREHVRDTSYRVAWRQLKDFVEQALLAVETGLFPLHEAFMAHVETTDPETRETVTVGELFERHATSGAGGLMLSPGGAP